MISVAGSKKLLCMVAAAVLLVLGACAVLLTFRLDALMVDVQTAVSSNSRAAAAVLWSADKTVAHADASLVDLAASANSLVTESRDVLRDLHRKADQAYVIANKTNAQAAASSAATYRMLRRLEVELLGEEQHAHKPGQPIIAAVRESIQGSTLTWGSVQKTLDGIGSQVAANGDASRAAIEKAGQAILHVDQSLVHLDAPIQASAQNIADATLHVAESTQSVDAALRPLRKAEGRLRSWLKVFAGFFRVTWPLR